MAENRTTPDRRTPGAAVMQFTRYWLPGGIALVGVVLIALGHGAYSYSGSGPGSTSIGRAVGQRTRSPARRTELVDRSLPGDGDHQRHPRLILRRGLV